MKNYSHFIFLLILILSGCAKENQRRHQRNIIDILEGGTWEITRYTIDGKDAMDSIDYHFPGRTFYFEEWFMDVSSGETGIHGFMDYQDSTYISGFIFFGATGVQVSMHSIPLSDKYGSDYHYSVIVNATYLPPLSLNSWTVKELDEDILRITTLSHEKRLYLTFSKK
jgi:hypothetical protein